MPMSRLEAKPTLPLSCSQDKFTKRKYNRTGEELKPYRDFSLHMFLEIWLEATSYMCLLPLLSLSSLIFGTIQTFDVEMEVKATFQQETFNCIYFIIHLSPER